MEGKVIFYIIAAVLYFLYALGKKAEEKKKQAQTGTKPAPKQQESEAPTSIEEIIREIKRKQAEAELRKTQQAKPKPAYQQQPVSKPQPKPQRDLLVHEKKKPAQVEGFNAYETVFERELTDEEKIERGNIKLANEGIYRIETMEEAEARSIAEEKAMHINMRDAVIGTLILDRKF